MLAIRAPSSALRPPHPGMVSQSGLAVAVPGVTQVGQTDPQQTEGGDQNREGEGSLIPQGLGVRTCGVVGGCTGRVVRRQGQGITSTSGMVRWVSRGLDPLEGSGGTGGRRFIRGARTFRSMPEPCVGQRGKEFRSGEPPRFCLRYWEEVAFCWVDGSNLGSGSEPCPRGERKQRGLGVPHNAQAPLWARGYPLRERPNDVFGAVLPATCRHRRSSRF